MLVAHLPAAYLAFAPALDRARLGAAEARTLLGVALVASVLPDVDLVAFAAMGGHVHHHSYPTHWPLAWLALVGLGALLLAWRPVWARTVLVAGASGLLHVVLDTVAGAIRWGAPFSDRATTLVEIPATHGSWIVSFVTHWTFGVELALVAAAAVLWWRRSRR